MTKHFLVSAAAVALIAGTGLPTHRVRAEGASRRIQPPAKRTVDVRLAPIGTCRSVKFRHAGETDGHYTKRHLMKTERARSDMEHDRSKIACSRRAMIRANLRRTCAARIATERTRIETSGLKTERKGQGSERSEDRRAKRKEIETLLEERGDSNRKSTTTTGQAGIRRQAFDRTAHQDHHGDQERAHSTGDQRQLLDFGWHPGPPRRCTSILCRRKSSTFIPAGAAMSFSWSATRSWSSTRSTLEIVAVLDA